MMFSYVNNKENYISFMDDNYIDYYAKEGVSYTKETFLDVANSIPDHHWFVGQKVKVYVNGSVEIIGGRFNHPKRPNENKHLGEYTDGSATIEFREKKGDPILQFEGVLSNGDVVNYESSKTLREGYGNLSTGTNFDTYDKSPAVNKWLARSWINGGEEELFFLVENKNMLDQVCLYYKLPVPYNNGLENILNNDLQATRIKSVDLNREGEGNWVALVVASVVFKDNVATKIRFYKTSRWND
tara:strand:- start:4843 stop:5568 length:726 start_codon:yes stop_codon:yes gene_type:complete